MVNPAPAHSLAPVSNELMLEAAGGVFSNIVGGILDNVDATYVPRSGMCRTCAKLGFVSDCAELPFHAMPVSKVLPDGTRAVVCTDYVREADR